MHKPCPIQQVVVPAVTEMGGMVGSSQQQPAGTAMDSVASQIALDVPAQVRNQPTSTAMDGVASQPSFTMTSAEMDGLCKTESLSELAQFLTAA